MARMNTAQAQVIDPILTTQARGYANAEMIADALMPMVDIPARNMRVLKFGKESFRTMNTRRAPGAETRRIEFGYADEPVALKQEALEGLVPIETMDDAQRVPNIDLAAETIRQVQDIIALGREKECADLARDPANYDPTHVEALAGNDQWNSGHDDANPYEVVADARETIRKAIGRYPNTLVIGAEVFARLDEQPRVRERLKYTSSASVTTDILARYFRLDRVIVGTAVFLNETDDDTAAATDVWGRDAILAYVPRGAQYRTPAFGYNYRLRGFPTVDQPYYENSRKSWVYPVTEEYRPYITGADAGFLIRNAVAAA